ncbi:MAG: Cold-shock DNA-binding domain [Chthoniobacter sp.]|jgi:cold shock CspA family protein|nr:Cold-shock DNA-binding domain [Chthoniobacter sp.]
MTTPNKIHPQLANLPKCLSFNGGSMLLAGPGRAPGSFAYTDPVKQVVHDVYLGGAVRTGAHYSLVEVPENAALRLVRIDPASLGQLMAITVGQQILFTGIEKLPLGLRARSSWVLPKAKPTPAPASRPASPAAQHRHRFIGRIIATKGTFGFIQPEKGQSSLFAHAGEFGAGSHLVVGEAVSYEIGSNDQGPCAVTIRPA